MELDEISRAIEAHTAATAATIAGLTGQIEGLKANLAELEQKSADGFASVPGGGRDLASTLVENDLLKSLAAKQRRDGGTIEVKTSELLGLEVKSTVTQNGDRLGPTSYAGLFPGLERRRFIFDLLPKVMVATGNVDVVRELTYTNNAAVTLAGSPAVFTEGVTKAESDISFELVSLRLPTTAHWLKASNQALADAPQLRGLLDRRLRYGLLVKNDAQILATMTTSGNYTSFTPSSGDDEIASINRCIAQAETNDVQPSAILLNPGTWRSIQRIRAADGDGQHIVGNPQQVTGEMLWGLPVLPTNSMTAGKVIVADFMTMGEYYVRESSVVDIGFAGDDFTKNLVTIRAENRGALQVIRPISVHYGDLTL